MTVVSAVELAVLIAAAFGAGVVDAIAGGGGLITVPMLLAVGVSPHAALGTNKGQSVFGAAASLATYWRAGAVTRGAAPWTFGFGLLGSVAGALAVHELSPRLLQPLVIAMLVAVAVLMLVKKPRRAEDAPGPRAFKWSLVLALVIGAYDGFMGPGTGTFLIVGFVLLCGATLPRATADAKVVNFASNLAAVAIFASRGHVLWAVALPMAAAQLAGGLVGARLALRGGAELIRWVVVGVSLCIVAKVSYELWA